MKTRRKSEEEVCLQRDERASAAFRRNTVKRVFSEIFTPISHIIDLRNEIFLITRG